MFSTHLCLVSRSCLEEREESDNGSKKLRHFCSNSSTPLVLLTIKLSRDIQFINYAIHVRISGLYVSPSATDVIL